MSGFLNPEHHQESKISEVLKTRGCDKPTYQKSFMDF